MFTKPQPHQDEVIREFERWIELFNKTGVLVDLGNHFITDDPANLTKSRLPSGASLAAGAYVTYTDQQLGLDFRLERQGAGFLWPSWTRLASTCSTPTILSRSSMATARLA